MFSSWMVDEQLNRLNDDAEVIKRLLRRFLLLA